MVTNASEADARQIIGGWAAHPARFIGGVLGARMWEGQLRMCEAVMRPRARVAVRGCHASTKTFTAAGIVLWWVSTSPDHLVITTAPTWKQVRRVLWTEIRRMASGIALPRMTQTSIEIDEHNYAVGVSTNDATRMQGFHGKVLVLIDEAPGVLPDLFEAIEGIRAVGDVRVLMLGNPTVPSGPFYESFHGGDAKNTQQITLSAMDTPNLTGLGLRDLATWDPSDPRLDEVVYPFTVGRRWVYEAYHKWGPDSPSFESRVLARFPSQDAHAIFPLRDLEYARRDPESLDLAGAVYGGLDVAGAGRDLTVLVLRAAGGGVIDVREWPGEDPRAQVIDVLRRHGPRLRNVNVDETGLGYYFFRSLKDARLPVTGVNFGASPRGAAGDGRAFADRRTELAWTFRAALGGGRVSGLAHPLLAEAWSDLSTVRYGQDADGRIELEDKADWRKRLPGRRSPDAAEALMLAYDEQEPAGAFHGQPAGAITRQTPTARSIPSAGTRRRRTW